VTRFRPLLRLLAALAEAGSEAKPQVEMAEVDPAVATEVRENRMLTPSEATELVEAYRHGGTPRALAKQYGVHRHTVDRHLERAGIAKRPVIKITAPRVARAKDLYAKGWSTQRIGRELDISQGAMYKALKRAGVRMRAPVV
jgi:DNA invertase Pin-like site-specific DNA recombinase